MKKKFNKLVPLLKSLKRFKIKYLLAILFFIIWMIFFDSHSYFDHKVLNQEIEKLKNNKQYFKNEIKSDSEKIKLYQNIDQIEKFAREKYFMKRKNEEIFIIEFEN